MSKCSNSTTAYPKPLTPSIDYKNTCKNSQKDKLMTKPQPRRSALAGQSVINQTQANPQTQTPTGKPQTGRSQKITVRIDEKVADEARGLFIAGLANNGPNTWSKWVEQALIAYNKQVRSR
ncbi:MAG: hypothetical protein E6905_10455, partial [Actinomyces sp.]|nr:hypothetical protein [Actinomyces sp.]